MYPRWVTNRPAVDPGDLATKYRRSQRLNVILAALSVFLLVVLVAQLVSDPVVSADDSTESSARDSDAADDSTGLELRDPDDAMAMGDVDAPVVLIEWTDMRCPFCAQFNREVLPSLVEEYVETGKVRIEVRDVAMFGEESQQASVAARAAGKQGLFFEYLSAVYEVAPDNAHPPLPRDELIGFAEQVGVPDLTQFTADLDDPELLAEVQQSTSDAGQIGINSVPFFVVGDAAMAGARPIGDFRDFLDDALDAAG